MENEKVVMSGLTRSEIVDRLAKAREWLDDRIAYHKNLGRQSVTEEGKAYFQGAADALELARVDLALLFCEIFPEDRELLQ